MDTQTKKKKIGVAEIIWMSVTGFFVIAGLFLIILGIVGSHLPILAKDNWIILSQDVLKAATAMDYRWWGVIAMMIGVVIGCFSLNHFAKKGDTDSVRNARRRERMQMLGENTPIEVDSTTPTESK